MEEKFLIPIDDAIEAFRHHLDAHDRLVNRKRCGRIKYIARMNRNCRLIHNFAGGMLGGHSLEALRLQPLGKPPQCFS